MLNRLTDYEMKELVARGGTLPHHNQGFENGAATEGMTDQREMADRVGGLGSEQRANKTLIEMQKDPSSKLTEKDLSKLEGVGIEDLKYMD